MNINFIKKGYTTLLLIGILLLFVSGCSFEEKQLSPEENKKPVEEEAEKGNTNIIQDILDRHKESTLYPAYIKNNNNGLNNRGYIDKEGRLVIEGKYNWVEAFNGGHVARVTVDSQTGLIDRRGNLLVPPTYSTISPYSEGLAVAFDGHDYFVLDEKGNEVFQIQGAAIEYVGSFSDGLAYFRDKKKQLYGYMDTQGDIILSSQFKRAHPFHEGKALVTDVNNRHRIIDKKGKVQVELKYDDYVGDISNDTIIYRDKESGKLGYASISGTEITTPLYDEAEPFKNDLAVVLVNTSDNQWESKYGVINKNGGYVLEPNYQSIRRIGEKLFAVSIEGYSHITDGYNEKAIFNQEGEQLTDYKYYDIGELKGGFFSVSEDKRTYFLNEDAKKVEALPELLGVGPMAIEGRLIGGYLDEALIYFNLEGTVIWQGRVSDKLTNGIEVMVNKKRFDKCMYIEYPSLEGLSDKEIQNNINEKLQQLFLKDGHLSVKQEGVYIEDTYIDFESTSKGDLITIGKKRHLYPIGAAHGMSYKTYYSINKKTGEFYTLKDLFKEDTDYLDTLTLLVKKKIQEENKEEAYPVYEEEIPTISSDQAFKVTEQGLEIIFQPYEIAPYSRGFPTFTIPYDDIRSIIDTGGTMWLSFNK